MKTATGPHGGGPIKEGSTTKATRRAEAIRDLALQLGRPIKQVRRLWSWASQGHGDGRPHDVVRSLVEDAEPLGWELTEEEAWVIVAEHERFLGGAR